MNEYFRQGFRSVLKAGNDQSEQQPLPTSVFNANTGSIFPEIGTQTKWKYARGNGRLQLHDGNSIHQFSYGEGEKDDQDYPMTKIEDVSYFDFGKDMEATGTAQVHRSNPGHIYVTLHDGKNNPTLNIKHVNETSWRASPKIKKKQADLDKSLFTRELNKTAIIDSLVKGFHHGANYLSDGIASIGKNPLASAGVGLGLGATYDLGRRAFYNSDEENEQETGGQRLSRYMIPSLGLGLTGGLMNSLMPNRYQFDPVYNATNPNNRPNTPPDDLNR